MFGKLSDVEIDEFLKSNLVGRIGCTDETRTYVVPISYAYHQGNVYAHTHEGMKLDMMRRHPNVCFEVDDTRDTGDWKSVIAWGTFEELTDTQQKQIALDQLSRRELPYLASSTMRLGANWPFTNGDINHIGGILFKILVAEKSGRFEKCELLKSYSK
jgi:uncharacterized protein